VKTLLIAHTASLRAVILFCCLSGLSLMPIPVYADWRAGIGAAADSLAESFRQQAESDRQLEQQKQLLEHQYKLERERREREFQLESERRDRERVEQERRREEERQQRIAADEKKKRDDDEAKRRALNTGTGFIVAAGGYLVTNYHVIEDKTDYAVRDYKGRFYRATVVARDSNRDLALLKVAGTFSPLRVISSDSATKGQHVLAVGYPQISIQGNESKVTDGIISSFTGIQNDDKWFQISVPIQGGNSGGPLVTESGAVIGVVVATANTARYFKLTGNLPQNVNYAIKSNVLLDFLKSNNVRTVSSSSAKSSIETVDASTVLVIGKNGPIDVTYTVSPEQLARDERERAKSAADEATKRRLADLELKKQAAADVASEAKRQKEEIAAEKRRQVEQRLERKKQQDEANRLEQRNLTVQRVFQDWPELRTNEIFVAWLGQQPPDIAQKLDSPKSLEVIAVLKRFQSERPEFSEKYFQQMGTWIADANGCKFLDQKPEPKESIVWNGKCDQGRGSGEGELIVLSDGVAIQKSTGMYKNGMKTGYGRVEFVGKGYIEGTFKNGKLEGKGKRIGIGDGSTDYEGYYVAGKPEGQGKLVWKDAGSYEGSFKDGKIEGRGKRIYKDGGIFEGEFRNGKFEGRGKLEFPNGNSIEGDFRDGKAEGQGKYSWKDGGFYVGAFRDGKFDGRGKKTDKNGNVYDGEFKGGKEEGNGTIAFSNGKVKAVQMRDGKITNP